MLKGFHCQADRLTEQSAGYYPSGVTIPLLNSPTGSPRQGFPISYLHCGWQVTAAELPLLHGEQKAAVGL